jgi:hypothetical protein
MSALLTYIICQSDEDARKNMLEVAYYTQETVDIRRDLRALLETAADRAKIAREVVLATMDKLGRSYIPL